MGVIRVQNIKKFLVLEAFRKSAQFAGNAGIAHFRFLDS